MPETNYQTNCQSNYQTKSIIVCQHRSCLQSGSAEVLAAFETASISNYEVKPSGCLGQCSSGPTVRITPEETWYCRVKTEDVEKIIEQHLKGGKRIDALLNPRIHLRFY